MRRSPRDCSCFVRYCHAAARYSLRHGAHDTDCALYRASGDPVDALHDRANREALHAIIERATQPPSHT